MATKINSALARVERGCEDGRQVIRESEVIGSLVFLVLQNDAQIIIMNHAKSN